jgi:prolyl 4-hydroxylase
MTVTVNQEVESKIVLTSYVVSQDPKISIVPEFLNPEECMHLIQLGEGQGFQRSLVGRGFYTTKEADASEGFENVPSESRTSQSVTLLPSHDSLVAFIEAKLCGLVDLPLDNLESLVLVKYEPGQVFRAHHDGIFRSKTVFIYLNDLPENAGGETRFPDINLRIRPRAGTAVVWSNSQRLENGTLVQDDRLLHEGLPPIGCVKYGVNSFFNYNEMR